MYRQVAGCLLRAYLLPPTANKLAQTQVAAIDSYRKADSDVVAERCAFVFSVAGDLYQLARGQGGQWTRRLTSNISPYAIIIISHSHVVDREYDGGLGLLVQQPSCHPPLRVVLPRRPSVAEAV